jgi:hypothetical protein
MLFDVGCGVDRFDIGNIGETGSLAPVHKLADRLLVCAPGVVIAYCESGWRRIRRNAWPLPGHGIGNDRRNLNDSAF